MRAYWTKGETGRQEAKSLVKLQGREGKLTLTGKSLKRRIYKLLARQGKRSEGPILQVNRMEKVLLVVEKLDT